MTLATILLQALNGLASAAGLFIVAAGLSVIFGVTRVVNFAHGSLYMLGAYGAYALISAWGGAGAPSAWAFYGGVTGAALLVGGVGLAIEVTVLRRIYRAPELLQLLATFGVVLIAEDGVLMAFGPEDRLGPRAPGLSGAVSVLGSPYPVYDLALIALGPLVLGALWLLFHRTRWGVRVRAATQDGEMAAALGINQPRLFSGVFLLGSILAGLGGALQIPRETITHTMDLQVIVEAFVVVVVGGMGSLIGAFLAAVLVGEIQAFGILLFPSGTLVLVFLVMAVVLAVRPRGLLGQPEAVQERPAAPTDPPWRVTGRLGRAVWLSVCLALLGAPALGAMPWGGDYLLYALTEVLIFALFAASLQFLMGGAGMTSFGHAAGFGLGAYGAALALGALGQPMPQALAIGLLAAGLGTLAFGWFCVRLTGVYMAMLTLACAQILLSAATQWSGLTGGDDGLLGLRPAPWAQGRVAFYYLVLTLCGAGVLALRHAARSPFGFGLRALRDAPQRAEAIGMDRRLQQWLGFALAGLLAGLAGGLFALFKGSVFPDVFGISTSLDALVMVLLGGLQAPSGALLGALVYKSLTLSIVPYVRYWHLLLGAVLVALVLLAPRGLLARRGSQAFQRAR